MTSSHVYDTNTYSSFELYKTNPPALTPSLAKNKTKKKTKKKTEFIAKIIN